MSSPTNYTEAMAHLKSRVATLEDRPQQDVAGHAIEAAIRDRSMLICQAGTGVGKSNAALIPAITSGGRVIYATATKVLQSQIVDKDLPFLKEHLGIDFTFASLKGWASYVCHARLAEMDDARIRQSILDEFEADPDHVGDQDSLITEVSSTDWMKLSITSQDCPGRKECPFGTVCKPQSARDRILVADVAVINHSVLATDAVIRNATDNGFTLLGTAETLIVDEAHELEEFISGVLGDSFSEGGVRHYAATLMGFSRRAGIETLIEDAVSGFGTAGISFFAALKPGRIRQADVFANLEAYEGLLDAYIAARVALGDDTTLNACSKIPDEGQRKIVRAQRDRLMRQASSKINALQQIMLASDTELVRYVEEQKKTYRGQTQVTLTLRTTPVNVSSFCAESLWPLYESSVLISATMMVDRKADYIVSRLGLTNYTAIDAGTPFNYQVQSRLYIPKHLPEPSGSTKNQWGTMANELTRDLVMASGGGALLLFTSLTALRQAWDSLRHRLPFECRRQGDDTNNKLMSWFRDENNGVLFATRSFFTGASFEGDTCRLVVIDKLPFPVPTDPVFEARAEEIKRNGGSDFAELSIPMMTLPLQQGFGRLIRTKSDSGVVAILDPRLETKGYGSKIVRSLPPATKVFGMDEVERFYIDRKASV